ncbi:MAG: hypothetical protein PHI81_01175 [Synergistaceae bacterium]|jgi:hypothetical protein|uniref:hypothetical protein n=1 Tax=Aminivibrio sp. TaxID=1872489 RepID=UPI00169F4767|nr:hypothetical protein [Synergistaceae bacterium]NCC58664.1 hypothetical protein [Synergistales bacterium]MDD3389924.1 hypothetical protein [Synergistaceae bacterium]MDD3688628.1 hypothetical protein [Synergistaceae bacterium]MDD4021527.1 hypothetical protein [Synergistaceae bacterium]
MINHVIFIVLGTIFVYILRFKILRKPLSPLKSAIYGAVIIIACIQFHYHYLPYETFRGGVAYTSTGFISFLILQYGYRKPGGNAKK